MPSATPEMITVAGPVTAWSASFLVGGYSSLVQYSVHLPISQPANRPTITLYATPGMPNSERVVSLVGISHRANTTAATTTKTVDKLIPRASALSSVF